MFKKLLSAVLSAATAASFIPQIPAKAEEAVPYPNVMFAGSDEERAITINSNNVCINGSIATNGTISTTAQNFNVNGSRTENAQETMKFFFNKIDSRYFTSHVDTYFEDYFLEDTNININIPIEAEGNIGLTGNINITSGIKALNDVVLSGNVENSQDSVICAETGDIIINTDNVNLNGLVYAPNGCVNITAQNLNINSVIIIADTITITCPNLNANYNSQMAEFIGNESEPVNNDDIEIVAYGEHDEETEAFTVYWNTTVPNGSFDIQASDDGENYTSIATVTDADSYECSFTETFEKKYIKVIETANNGKITESVPFVIISTEDGYDVKVLDSDEDGLPDIYELKIGTDLYDQDTDNDGLTDYQEYVYTQTDPFIYDSITAGVSDADIDTDEDGLSNIDEFTKGTYPWTSDTDQDGLSDYDEIYVYGTDPLIADSDEDGLDDGSEIKLGFDPYNPATNGVPDGVYAVQQTINSDNSMLSSINTTESPYELSIDIKTNGDAEKELTVDESGYSAAIENDAMIGASVDIDITDTCNPEEIVLKYNIKDGYTENTLNNFSSLEKFQGIMRLNVFRFDEEERMLLPVETEYDVENNKLYAAVNETGTYCLMDMEIWLDNLDVKMPAENNIPAPKAAPNSLSTTTSKWKPEYVNAPIDFVFILQSAGSDKNSFNKEREVISSFCSYAFSKYEDIRVYIITFGRNKANILRNDDLPYHNSLSSIINSLNSIQYENESGFCDRSKAFRELFVNVNLRDNADKFIYEFMNGITNTSSNYTEMKVINTNLGSYSEIFPIDLYYENREYGNDLIKKISERGDLFIFINEVTLEKMIEHIERKITFSFPTYNILLPTKWKKISLKGELIPDGTTNSDTDSLTDWEEVDTSKINVNSDNSIELPVFCIANIVGHLTKFNQNGDYNFLVSDTAPRYYLPILSDPTDEDTDDDGINDDEDDDPLYPFLECFSKKMMELERNIDDYLNDQLINDINKYDHSPITSSTTNSDIAINIIRDLYYGSEKKNKKDKTFKDITDNFIQSLKWNVTDGNAFPIIKEYIEKENPSILQYFREFRRDGSRRFYDKHGNEVDILHLLATLGGQRHVELKIWIYERDIIDPNLSGWAGDLQSTIYDLKKITYGENVENSLDDVCYQILLNDQSLINENIKTVNTKFNSPDLYADVDAKNIYELYSDDCRLSSVLTSYYKYYADKRFTFFVGYYGGITAFNSIVSEYTKGNHPIKHLILNTFAESAAKLSYVQQKYKQSYIETIYGADMLGEDVYSLPDPAKVTDNESKALQNAFVRLIGEKLNEETK